MRSISKHCGISFAAVAIAAAVSAPVHAQTQQFNLPAQAAAEGIRAFARQANIEVLVSSEAARGRTTNAVQGSHDVRAALGQLLSGTGLTVRTFDGKTAMVGAEPAEADAGDAIVVTGSRISRPELDSAMPVSVVRMDQAEAMGITTLYDALTQDPAIGPGVGRGNAQGQAYDGGTASVNLRNMGTNRTLTLIDGRRRVSGSARSSAVDLNMIPAAMVDRIEVVTGGAAAIYGADAVTGAVNVITKRDIDGLEISATSGISEHGDASETSVSLATGGTFADGRGSFTVGGTYVHSKELLASDRDYGATRLLYGNNNANTNGSDGVPDRVIYYNFGEFYYLPYATFALGDANYGYENGALRQLHVDTPTNTPGEFYGGDGGDVRNLFHSDQLRSPLEQYAIISRFDYALTDGLRLNARFDYGRSKYKGTKRHYREDSRNLWLNGAGGARAYLDNPYLPDPIRQMMIDNDITELPISRSYEEFGIFEDNHDRESFTFVAGLEGNLVGDLTWDAFYQYGRVEDDIRNPNQLMASRWIAARDVITDPATDAPVCRDTDARAAGCVPYDIFSVNGPSAAQREWLFATRNERRVNTQEIIGGGIVGPLFALPYGDLSIALGAEHRKESLETVDDPLATSGEIAHSGLTGPHPDIRASFKVSEIYGEVVVPILADLPFAHRLEVEGAYRYSDYSTVGGTDAWKIGGAWSPVSALTVRGVRSRSVRTPNFGELYTPIDTAPANLGDPCEGSAYYASSTRAANCAALGIATPGPNSVATSMVTSGGNPDLEPETSDSLTVGMVYRPDFIPGLDITVDYWTIDIEKVITQFSANQIASYCVDLPNVDNLFCEQMTRDPASPVRHITSVSTQYVNASGLSAKGVDFGLSYRRPLGAGRLGVGFKASYLIAKDVQAVIDDPETKVQEDGGYADPRFRATAFANYEIGRFGFSWNGRFISSAMYDENAVSDEYYEDNTVPARMYNDLSVSFAPLERYRLTIGVNNVFGVEPPYMPGTYLGASGRYDVLGRYFFASAKARF